MSTILLRWSEWKTTRAPQGQFWIYFVAAIFFNFGFSVFFFLFNIYLVGFGLDERSLGIIGSAMAVGTLCGTIPAGIAAQRFGLRWTLGGGVALACIASVLRVIFVAPQAAIPLAVVSGIGLCTWGVCLSPAVASLTSEEQRPTAFSLTFASGIGMAGVGAFAAGHLPGWITSLASRVLSPTQSERYALLLGIAVSAISLVPLTRLTLQPAAPHARLVRPTSPFLRRFLPAMGVWAFVTGAFPPFANVFFVHHLGLSLEAMGSVFSFSQLVQFAAILAAPLLFRRTGLRNGILFTQLATASMLVALARVENVSFAGWMYWGYMAFQCMNEPGIYGLLMDRVPEADRSGASSYTFFVSAGSQIVASTAVGMLIVRFSYSTVLYGIAALAVLASLMFRSLRADVTAHP